MEKQDCKKCLGYCCVIAGWVRLSPVDTERLAKYTKLTVERFTEKYTVEYDGSRALRKRPNSGTGVCVFLRGGMCSVYKARPDTCKGYHCWEVEDFICGMKQGLDLLIGKKK